MGDTNINLISLMKIVQSKWDTVGLLNEFEIIPQTKECPNGHDMYLTIPEGEEIKTGSI